MKVLLTNHQLDEYAGTETVTYSLAHAMRRAGHETVIATSREGAVAELLKNDRFEVAPLDRLTDRTFDVIHAHHNTMAMVARQRFAKTPLVFTSHGILEGLESPPSVDIGAGAWAAVSEEVRDAWDAKGLWDAASVDVVRNAVDTERYKPRTSLHAKPRRVLVISNYMRTRDRDMVAAAAKRVGARASFIGSSGKHVWQVEDEIDRADIVISLGRGCIEAMACGRAVVVYGHHGGDGIVTARNYEAIRKHNFSGRCCSAEYDASALADELARYDPSMGEVNRELVLGGHDIDKALGEYEELWKKAQSSGVPDSLPPIPADELVRYQSEIADLIALVKRMDRHPVVKVLRRFRNAGLSAIGKPRD